MMDNQLESVKLKEIALIGDGAHASLKREDSGILYLTSKNFKQDGISLDTVDYISEETYQKYFKESSKALTKPKENDILLSIIGTMGAPYIVKENDVFGLSSSVSIIRPNNEIVDSKYLYYWIKSPMFQGSIESIKSGVAQSFLSLPMIGSLPIKYPKDLKQQKKIAKILSNYDDLIENNLKQIKLLEEKARLTYEEWFEFRKIDGKQIGDDKINIVIMEDLLKNYMNGGWGKEELDGNYNTKAYVIRGTDIPDILKGNYQTLPLRFHTQSNLSSRILDIGDIAIEMSNGNINNVGRSFYFDRGTKDILNENVMCASFCKMIKPKNINVSYLLDQHLKYIHSTDKMLIYKSQGANGINNFRFEDMINEELIYVPEDDLLEKLTKSFSKIYDLVSTYRMQIKLLNESRDILLPRLMTGMIDVEKLDIEV